jgi:hypothetical protein
MAAKEFNAARSNIQLKTPKGTRDWFGSDLILREHILYVLQVTLNILICVLTCEQPDHQRRI